MSSATPARPNLLPVAAFVSLLVLALAATGLFALHLTNQKTAADLARVNDAEEMLVLTLRTRGAFKTQVQEWKNILLRGRNPADFARHRANFTAEETFVHESIETLARNPPNIDFETGPLPFHLSLLLTEHENLSKTYRDALAAHDLASQESPFLIDGIVRGADRKLSDMLDQLAIAAERVAAKRLKQMAEHSTARYEALRRITWIVASLAVLASLWLCFRATRVTS